MSIFRVKLAEEKKYIPKKDVVKKEDVEFTSSNHRNLSALQTKSRNLTLRDSESQSSEPGYFGPQ